MLDEFSLGTTFYSLGRTIILCNNCSMSICCPDILVCVFSMRLCGFLRLAIALDFTEIWSIVAYHFLFQSLACYFDNCSGVRDQISVRKVSECSGTN
jgi:hypothetical protein